MRRIFRDPVVVWLMLGSSVVSILAFVYFFRKGEVVVYEDAVSHMEISKRFVDGSTPGFGQLGGVWLPLPHILMAPLVLSDTLYYNGAAGSVISMLSYVVTTVLIYKIVFSLTERKLAAVIAAIAFMFNPNVLYMQSTPMTEMLLFAGITGMVYGVQRWIQTDNYRYLMGAGTAAFFATLTRYESWVLLPVLMAIVLLTAWRRKIGRAKTGDIVLAFGILSTIGIALWMTWNQMIFGSPLNFQNGEYAKPSLWVGAYEPAVGNWNIAARTYWFAITTNLRLYLVIFAGLGLALILVRDRLSLKTLPVLSLLVYVPFFVVALYKGQRPLHVMEVTGDLYNVRFGLILILPAACLAGYLATLIPEMYIPRFAMSAGVITAIAVVGTSSMAVNQEDIATLQEPRAFLENPQNAETQGASEYLDENYDGGLILMESFGNESVLYDARIDFDVNIYEGSYQQWEPAIEYPKGHDISWIVMRHSEGTEDKLYESLFGSSTLDDGYVSVYEDENYFIYRREALSASSTSVTEQASDG